MSALQFAPDLDRFRRPEGTGVWRGRSRAPLDEEDDRMKRKRSAPSTIAGGQESAFDYWSGEVIPRNLRYLKLSTKENGLDAADAAWHLHERIAREESVPLHQFQQDEIGRCPELRWLRDITEMKKHGKLDREDVEVAALVGEGQRGTSYFATPVGNYEQPGGFPLIVVLKDGRRLRFSDVLTRVIDHWKTTRFASA